MRLFVHSVYGDTITCKRVSGKAPEVGREYTLEDATSGTNAQNRFFHLLLRIYFTSGCFSDDVNTFYELRQQVLRRLGKGFEKFLYVDKEGNLQVTKDPSEIPPELLSSPEEKRKHVRAQLYSWTSYSLKERQYTVKALIAEMKMTGVSGKEFEDILEEYDNG